MPRARAAGTQAEENRVRLGLPVKGRDPEGPGVDAGPGAEEAQLAEDLTEAGRASRSERRMAFSVNHPGILGVQLGAKTFPHTQSVLGSKTHVRRQNLKLLKENIK